MQQYINNINFEWDDWSLSCLAYSKWSLIEWILDWNFRLIGMTWFCLFLGNFISHHLSKIITVKYQSIHIVGMEIKNERKISKKQKNYIQLIVFKERIGSYILPEECTENTISFPISLYLQNNSCSLWHRSQYHHFVQISISFSSFIWEKYSEQWRLWVKSYWSEHSW